MAPAPNAVALVVEPVAVQAAEPALPAAKLVATDIAEDSAEDYAVDFAVMAARTRSLGKCSKELAGLATRTLVTSPTSPAIAAMAIRIAGAKRRPLSMRCTYPALKRLIPAAAAMISAMELTSCSAKTLDSSVPLAVLMIRG